MIEHLLADIRAAIDDIDGDEDDKQHTKDLVDELEELLEPMLDMLGDGPVDDA